MEGPDEDGDYYVKFEVYGETSVAPDDIKLVEEELLTNLDFEDFEDGDRVEIQCYGNSEEWKGQRGTVIGTHGNVYIKVEFDDQSVHSGRVLALPSEIAKIKNEKPQEPEVVSDGSADFLL